MADSDSAAARAGVVLGYLRAPTLLYELEELETTIGRGEECDLVLDGNGISRLHARLCFHRGGFKSQITDMLSSNGTFVNDLRLQPHVPHDLEHGSVIRFSVHEKTVYVFELALEPPQPRATPSVAAGGARPRNASLAKPDRAAGFCPRGKSQDSVGQSLQPLQFQSSFAPAAAPVNVLPAERPPCPPSTAAPFPCSAPVRGRSLEPRGRMVDPSQRGTPVLSATANDRGVISPATRSVPVDGLQREEIFAAQPVPKGGSPPKPSLPSSPPWADASSCEQRSSDPSTGGQAAAPAFGQAQNKSMQVVPSGPLNILPMPMPYFVPQMAPANYGSSPSPRPASRERPPQIPNMPTEGDCFGDRPGCSSANNRELMERLRQLEDQVGQIREEQVGLPAKPSMLTESTVTPAAEGVRDADRQSSDASALARSALSLQRAADHLFPVLSRLRRLKQRIKGVEADCSASSLEIFGKDDGLIRDDERGGLQGLAQQVTSSCRKLERMTTLCAAETSELRGMIAQLGEATALSDGACDSSVGVIAELEKKRLALQSTLQDVNANDRLRRSSHFANHIAAASHVAHDDSTDEPEIGVVEAMDDVVTELRKHVSLYGKALGHGNRSDACVSESAESDEARDDALSGDCAGTMSSIRSLTRGQHLGRDEVSSVLAALIAAKRRIVESDSRVGNGRRWSALGGELRRLQEESVLQQRRADGLRLDVRAAARAAEVDIAKLCGQVSETKRPSTFSVDDVELTSQRCSAVLLQQLEAMEAAKAGFAERLSQSKKSVVDTKRRLEDVKARSAIAGALHADAEEAADRIEEGRHNGAAQRVQRLHRANVTLKAQVAATESLLANVQNRLCALSIASDRGDVHHDSWKRVTLETDLRDRSSLP
eukprot:TRINITY_DN11458_c0_g1_i1.p1 TRINITY_DN11458_c0_g1~~TRINITY_DN11458_c0_g1_i1.p1  ORF type:complete len:886 (+),score=119.96 TRINITY_DN11458_c0_g1_i1:142-2799(+)